MQQLKRLKEIGEELSTLGGISSVLHWDSNTELPRKAVKQRAEHLSYLTTQYHKKITSEELKNIINFLSEEKNLSKLSENEKLIVKKYKKDLVRITKLPEEFVKEASKVYSESYHAWEEAKQKSDFSIFEPHLEKVISTKIKEAKYIDPKEIPYDVLLYDYEEGMTVEQLKKIFAELRDGIVDILNNIKKSKKYNSQKDILKTTKCPEEVQKKIVDELFKIIIDDQDRAVLGVSAHPFTTLISSDDVRLTTNYTNTDLVTSMSHLTHESGHALYNLNYPKELENTILFGAPSIGIHESQSRLWENLICKSREFWKFYYPKLREKFDLVNGMSEEEFYFYSNLVTPSLVRIESDEVTYSLHIIIRFELDVALMEGKIKVKDLSREWNKKYNEYLGVVPKTDKEGVLQDVHWSEGYFGYFPTYAIGTMYSVMLFNQMKKENKNLTKEIEKGDFKFIKKWLKEKIHSVGSKKLTHEIIRDVCGRDLTAKDYLEYLREKYYGLYGINPNS